MTFDTPEQLAGAARIKFYLLTETGNWPVVVTDGNAGQVTFAPEPVSLEGFVVPESIRVNDAPNQTDNGDLWPIDLSYTFMARSAGAEQIIEQYANKPGIAIASFNDEALKLFGSNIEPVYLKWRNLYGTRPEDGHGLEISISGTLSQRPVYYNPQP